MRTARIRCKEAFDPFDLASLCEDTSCPNQERCSQSGRNRAISSWSTSLSVPLPDTKNIRLEGLLLFKIKIFKINGDWRGKKCTHLLCWVHPTWVNLTCFGRSGWRSRTQVPMDNQSSLAMIEGQKEA